MYKDLLEELDNVNETLEFLKTVPVNMYNMAELEKDIAEVTEAEDDIIEALNTLENDAAAVASAIKQFECDIEDIRANLLVEGILDIVSSTRIYMLETIITDLKETVTGKIAVEIEEVEKEESDAFFLG